MLIKSLKDSFPGIFDKENILYTKIFFIMSFVTILPLFFEQTRQLAGLVFLAFLIYLLTKVKRTNKVKLSNNELVWMVVAILFATVSLLSYVLRPPYTDDGSWRNAVPIFIFLFIGWYWLSIRYQQSKYLILYIAISSIIIALVLFFTELYIVNAEFPFRYGLIFESGLRGLAAIGFILPITTILLAVLWIKSRQNLFLVLMLMSLLLTGLNGSRTSISILGWAILLLGIYFLFFEKKYSFKIKAILILVLLICATVLSFLAKEKLYQTLDDIEKMSKNNYASSLGLRVVMVKTNLHILESNWLLGVGPNQYKESVTKAVHNLGFTGAVKHWFTPPPMQLHNQYLMSMLLSGVVGLVSVLLFLVYPVFLFYQLLKRFRTIEYFLLVGGGLGILFVMMFGAILTFTYTTIFYVLSMSALISYFSQNKLEKESDNAKGYMS